MSKYEITYLTLNEESNSADSVRPILENHKATVTSVNLWDGRRKLAYPIKKQDQGFYTTVVFEADASAIAGIERDLRLNDAIVRSLIVVFEPGLFQRSSETTRPVRESRPVVREAELVETPAEIETKPEVKETPEEATPEVEAPKPKRASRKASKEEVQALDEKLDELLNEDLTK